MVYKISNVPVKTPTDFPTYALYHLYKNQKDIDSTSVVFSDLSETEKATSFLLSMSESER
jgi:hypothetical protein